jgi:molecular chaperone DnaK (HSP70)
MGERHRLIVGVDFGTTFTGISFAMAYESPEVHQVENWPQFDGSFIRARKTPTQIAYVDGLASKPWGYQVRDSGMAACAWMKYHLDREAAESNLDDPGLRDEMRRGLFRVSSLEGIDLVAERVTTDYLTEVLSFTVRQLEREYSRAILSVTNINFWLTRPSVWGFHAVHKLMTAVEMAARAAKFPGLRGQDEYGLIVEPEAAAFALTDAPEYDVEDGIEVI